ncbi:lysylphosphatidylglycerol synthase transmembrane domain-containing protein [Pacificispira sp.]|uniref:lysylphosphatidylglycerol synthase transmembrane domain-containing protein n=1 Tax=Pacificispira sp. TaxID=2888761 RepID=UPI003B518EB4
MTQTSASKSPWRRPAAIALKIAVTGLLFWLIAQDIDLEEIGSLLRAADPLLLIAATGLIVVQLICNSARWRRLMAMDGVSLPFARSFRFYLEGMFFNQALPGAIGGDVMRVYRVRPFCAGIGQAVNGVVLDRVTGLIGLCVMILIGLPLLLERVGDTGILGGFAGVFVAGLAGVVVLALIARLSESGRGGRLRGAAVRFAQLFDRLLRRPSEALPVLALAVATHALVIATAYLSAHAIGLTYRVEDCLIVVPTSILVSTLPISLGGWGVREGAFAAGFVLIGAASAGDAGPVALGIVMGLELLVVGLIGGAVWFFGGAIRPTEPVTAEGGE